MPSSKFSFHKFPVKGQKDKYLDDGVCEVCGNKKVYVLISNDKPKMCYKCYQSIRAYQSLLVDVLKLKRKKTLNLKDCKRIVHYMHSYARKKLMAIGLVGALLGIANSEK